MSKLIGKVCFDAVMGGCRVRKVQELLGSTKVVVEDTLFTVKAHKPQGLYTLVQIQAKRRGIYAEPVVSLPALRDPANNAYLKDITTELLCRVKRAWVESLAADGDQSRVASKLICRFAEDLATFVTLETMCADEGEVGLFNFHFMFDEESYDPKEITKIVVNAG